MRSVTYSMGVSLDGYIVGPDGGFDWSTPDKEVFRFWIDEIRDVGVHLMGRRLYETMLYWETADEDPSLDDAEIEWTALWKPLPKVVFSTTLSAVQGNARLASGGLAEEIDAAASRAGGGRHRDRRRDACRRGGRVGSHRRVPDRGTTRCWLAVAFRTFRNASAEWISSSSRPAPSARRSSTSATALRASSGRVASPDRGVGWRARIRTWNPLIQSQLSYRWVRCQRLAPILRSGAGVSTSPRARRAVRFRGCQANIPARVRRTSRPARTSSERRVRVLMVRPGREAGIKTSEASERPPAILRGDGAGARGGAAAQPSGSALTLVRRPCGCATLDPCTEWLARARCSRC